MFKPVLKPADAAGQILNYEPKTFTQQVPAQAVPFMASQSTGLHEHQRDFEMNSLVAHISGVEEAERKSFHSRLEAEVLTKLKSVEEKAYKEAYDLGLKEGHKRAFEEANAEIRQALDQLGQVAGQVSELKAHLVVANEKHLIETVFHIAQALALQEIKGNPASIMTVITKALENAQSEEEITLRLSPQDAAFIETVKGEVGNPLERVSRLRVEVSDSIIPGGCVLETNYGVIDATIEQRVKKLWDVLEAKIPKPAGGT